MCRGVSCSLVVLTPPGGCFCCGPLGFPLVRPESVRHKREFGGRGGARQRRGPSCAPSWLCRRPAGPLPPSPWCPAPRRDGGTCCRRPAAVSRLRDGAGRARRERGNGRPGCGCLAAVYCLRGLFAGGFDNGSRLPGVCAQGRAGAPLRLVRRRFRRAASLNVSSDADSGEWRCCCSSPRPRPCTPPGHLLGAMPAALTVVPVVPALNCCTEYGRSSCRPALTGPPLAPSSCASPGGWPCPGTSCIASPVRIGPHAPRPWVQHCELATAVGEFTVLVSEVAKASLIHRRDSRREALSGRCRYRFLHARATTGPRALSTYTHPLVFAPFSGDAATAVLGEFDAVLGALRTDCASGRVAWRD